MKRTVFFTMIELLVVVSILVVLVFLLLPALSGARESSLRMVCLSGEKQIAVALAQYIGDHDDWIVPGVARSPIWEPEKNHGWDVLVWGYLSEIPVARFADQMMRRKSIFCCPSDLRNTYRRSYTLNQKLTIVTTAEGDYSGQPKYKLHQLRNPSSLILASEFQQYRSGSAIYHNRLFEPQYAATGDFSWPFPDQRCFHGGVRNNSVFLDLHAATVNPLVYRDLRYWQP